ncbi:hypothetical protein [Bacillus sp. 1NLA3E]|uniref:hypothetical protein n=1 Tax=Bacillus sp. 1NLA3E TaxID=666686 RepID=UPI000247EC21|nr:hypothetical protein [Bacillus sp. 1NLA3E]AGK52352.1 hypothetical protein B1NLA3E_02860 [Bacillus sp. 1NLA3E]
MKGSKALIILSISLVFLAVISAGVGLFWNGGGSPFSFTTVHGETSQIYGHGLYKFDTLMKAPIFRGTDAAILFVATPFLIFSIYQYSQGTLKGQLLLLGSITCFLYYSSALVFGVAYNQLFIVYVAFFSVSLYAFILGFMTINLQELPSKILPSFPHRGISLFLIISGILVFVVWFLDIIVSLVNGHVPVGIESYTTEVTYVLDLGIISPTTILIGILLTRRVPISYPLASSLLILCSLIGIIVVSQTIAQLVVGVSITPGQLIAFVGVFVCLSLFAAGLTIKLFRNIRNEQQ